MAALGQLTTCPARPAGLRTPFITLATGSFSHVGNASARAGAPGKSLSGDCGSDDGDKPILETLLKILSWDLPSPEILLEEDGDLGLDWGPAVSVSINPAGGVSWATEGGMHGTDIDELEKRIKEVFAVGVP